MRHFDKYMQKKPKFLAFCVLNIIEIQPFFTGSSRCMHCLKTKTLAAHYLSGKRPFGWVLWGKKDNISSFSFLLPLSLLEQLQQSISLKDTYGQNEYDWQILWKLPCNWKIATIGPIWRGMQEQNTNSAVLWAHEIAQAHVITLQGQKLMWSRDWERAELIFSFSSLKK